jgi:hypothetical protein
MKFTAGKDELVWPARGFSIRDKFPEEPMSIKYIDRD